MFAPTTLCSGCFLNLVEHSRQVLETERLERRRFGLWKGRISHVGFILGSERLEPQS